jgi:hypothetical protein
MCGLLFHPEDGGDIFFETLAGVQRIMRRCTTKDRSCHNHESRNVKSYKYNNMLGTEILRRIFGTKRDGVTGGGGGGEKTA